MRVLRLPAAHPAALRFLRLAVPRLHSLRSLLDGRVRRRGLELVTRYLHPGICRGNDRISQVPGEPQLSVCTCSIRRRQDCLHQTITVQQRGPWYDEQKQRLPRKVFRRSIAWLSDSLSTLRRVRYLPRRKTRFRPLVRRYRTGLSTRKVPMKGFKAVSNTSLPPFPSFLDALGRSLS